MLVAVLFSNYDVKFVVNNSVNLVRNNDATKLTQTEIENWKKLISTINKNLK